MTAVGMQRTASPPDAVTILTIYLVLLLAIPASMVLSAMGQIGGPSTLLAVVCFLWWAWHRVHRNDHWDASAQPVRNAALLFLLAVAVCYVHSAGLALPGDERSSADGGLVRMVGAVGLVCVFAEGVDDRDRLWTFARRWVLGIGVMSALALVQIATGQLWVDRLSIPGLTPAEGLGLIQRGLITRPSGTATHPIEFSAMLAMTMPLVFAVAGRETRRPRLLKLIALCVPVVILLTGSRTALVCGAIAFLVMMTSWSRQARLVAGGLTALTLPVMFVAKPGLLGGLGALFSGASSDPSVTSRTNSYSIAAFYWEHHPWLGRGVGTLLPRYWIFDNMYLNLLVGGGLVVVAALLWLLLVAARSAVRASRRFTAPADKQLATAGLAGVLAGGLSLAFFDSLAFPQATGTLFLLIGLSGATFRLASDPKAVAAVPAEPVRPGAP